MNQANAFETDLDRNPANHAPLTPLSFIERAAYVYPERTAVVHGARRYTWSETYARCRRLASALAGRGIGKGDTVAVMAPNMPAMYECPFRRADAGRGAEHAQHAPRRRRDRLHAGSRRGAGADHRPRVFRDRGARAGAGGAPPDGHRHRRPGVRRRGALLGEIDYEAFLAEGDPDYAWQPPADEWDAIALNYTSGTTGNPKGVVYHHRGAYLNAVCNIVTWGMPQHSVYLWTLPMFHCNGWCFPWTMAANAGVNVCLRRVDPKADLRADPRARVTHYLRRADRARHADQRRSGRLRAGIDHKVVGA